MMTLHNPHIIIMATGLALYMAGLGVAAVIRAIHEAVTPDE